MANSDAFLIGPAPVSFPNVFEAKPLQGVAGGDPFFSCVFILSPEQIQDFYQKAQEFAQQAFPNGEYNSRQDFKWPWVQVEAKAEAHPDRAAKFPGHWLINTKAQANFQPQVLDATVARDQNGNLKPFTNRAMLVAGTHCYGDVNFYSYQRGNNIGIACGINGLVVTGDCTPFTEGGGGHVQQTFQNIPVTPAQGVPAGMPPAGGYVAPTQPPVGQPAPTQAPMSPPAQSAPQQAAPAAPGSPQIPGQVPPMNFNQ